MFTCLLLFVFVCFCLFLLASLIFGYRCKEWSFYLIIVMRRQKARRHMKPHDKHVGNVRTLEREPRMSGRKNCQTWCNLVY